MSAFIVSEACMHMVVSALLPEASCEERDELGRKLYALNDRAVKERYQGRHGTEVPEPMVSAYVYRPTLIGGDHVRMVGFTLASGEGSRGKLIAALKAIECLHYQCSEGNVPDDPLYERLTAAIADMSRAVVHALPEYNAAPWG